MDRLKNLSPLKRKIETEASAAAAAAAASPAKMSAAKVEQGNPNWPCLDFEGCKEGRLKIVPKKNDGDDDTVYNDYDQDYFVDFYCVHMSRLHHLRQALNNFDFLCVTHTPLVMVYSCLQ